MAGGVLEVLMNGGTTTTEVLFLVPELLFLAFVAAVAVDSSIGLVASIHSSRERRHAPAATVAYSGSGSGEAQLRTPLATLLTAAGVAMLAAMAVHTLVHSLRVVLEAPVAVVIVAAAAAVATVALAVVVSVAVLATLLVAAGTWAVVLVSIYETFRKKKLGHK